MSPDCCVLYKFVWLVIGFLHCTDIKNWRFPSTINMYISNVKLIQSLSNSIPEILISQSMYAFVILVFIQITQSPQFIRIVIELYFFRAIFFSPMRFLSHLYTVKPVCNDHLYNKIFLPVIYLVIRFNEDWRYQFTLANNFCLLELI